MTMIKDTIAETRLKEALAIAADLPGYLKIIARSDDRHLMDVTLERLQQTQSIAAGIQERSETRPQPTENMSVAIDRITLAKKFLEDDNNSVMAYRILSGLLEKIT